MFFSQESNSTIYNHKCLFVRPSVCQQNPSTAWNHHPSSFILHYPSSYILHHPSSFFIISQLLSFSACLSVAKATIQSQMSIRLSVTKTLQPLRIASIEHQAYQPLSLSTIIPVDHQANPIKRSYQPSSPLTIEPIDLSSPFATFKPFGLFINNQMKLALSYLGLNMSSDPKLYKTIVQHQQCWWLAGQSAVSPLQTVWGAADCLSHVISPLQHTTTSFSHHIMCCST